MDCIKCGRETSGKDVFCPECLRAMAASPVKPGTPVILPRRDTPLKRSSSRKQLKPELQIARMRKTIRRLRIAVAVLAALFVIAATALCFRLFEDKDAPTLGQNYSTAFSAAAP